MIWDEASRDGANRDEASMNEASRDEAHTKRRWWWCCCCWKKEGEVGGLLRDEEASPLEQVSLVHDSLSSTNKQYKQCKRVHVLIQQALAG